MARIRLAIAPTAASDFCRSSPTFQGTNTGCEQWFLLLSPRPLPQPPPQKLDVGLGHRSILKPDQALGSRFSVALPAPSSLSLFGRKWFSPRSQENNWVMIHSARWHWKNTISVPGSWMVPGSPCALHPARVAALSWHISALPYLPFCDYFFFLVRQVPLPLGPAFSQSTEVPVKIPSHPWAAAPHPLQAQSEGFNLRVGILSMFKVGFLLEAAAK